MDTSFDVIVIGGGAAGLTMSGLAASLGAKTILIDRSRLGGDCTWTGCVPSKMLLKAASIAHTVRQAGTHGVHCPPPAVDFAQIRARLHRLREDTYRDADNPDRMAALGVEVCQGHATLLGPRTVEIGGAAPRRVRGRILVIASGAEARIPPIPGLERVAYLTNESLFERETLPERLTIIGAGPIGMEMAQAFTRLGALVTVLERESGILHGRDPEMAALLAKRLESEGIRLCTAAHVSSLD